MAKGRFTPKFPEKYIGDVTKIFYRSSWELTMMNFFDSNMKVLKYSSEEISVPYIKPTDGKVHKYYPDFYVEFINNDNEVVKELIEVKPYKETVLTKKSTDYDKISIAINEAKWKAAQAFCDKGGITFRLITEKQLYGGKK